MELRATHKTAKAVVEQAKAVEIVATTQSIGPP